MFYDGDKTLLKKVYGVRVARGNYLVRVTSLDVEQLRT